MSKNPYGDQVVPRSSLTRSKSVGEGTRRDGGGSSSGRRGESRKRDSGSSTRSRASRSGIDGAQSVPDQRSGTPSAKASSRHGHPEKSRRSKRSGYDHAAAKSSNPDMLEMPDGGISHSMAKALKKKIDPFYHTHVSAGLLSEQLTSSKSTYIADRRPQTTKPVYYPQQVMNPVNHADVPVVHVIKDTTLTQGAAGIATDRLTKMQATWITEKDAKAQSKMHGATSDVIAHTAPEPQPSKKGLRLFDRKDQHDAVTIAHVGGAPEPMPIEDVAKWAKLKQVRIRGGEFIYNVAGQMDLLPAATKPYAKADKPPSQSHRAENDKRWLPKFYRKSAAEMPANVKSVESEDMAFVMGMETESALGLDDRESRISINSQDAYYRISPQMARSQSARPAYGRGYYATSEDNLSIRSDDPGLRFSPPTRSQASGSVYEMERY